MSKGKNLTTDRLFPLYVHYLLTSVGGMLGQAFYVLGDTVIVGQALGAPGLAALNISIPVINLLAGIGLLLGIGGSTALSVDKGKGKMKSGDEFFSFSLVSALIFGLFVILVRILFLEEVSLLLGANQETLKRTMNYLGMFLWFSPFFILNMMLAIFVRNDGAPKLAMISMLAASFTNVFLDYVLMIYFNTGMTGGAFATGVAPIVGLAVLSTHFIKKQNNIHFVKLTSDKIGGIWKRIVSNGLSSFVIELSAGLVIIAFNQVLLRIEGTLAVSAYSIIANLSLIGAAIFTGVGQAIQPLVSTNFGAGAEERTLKTARLGLLTAFVLGVLFLAVGYIFTDPLMKLFVSDPSEIADITRRGIHIYFFSFLLTGVNIVLASFKQSKEKVKGSMLISLSRGLVLVLAILFILSRTLGIDGVWLSMPLAELGTFLFALLVLRESRRAVMYTLTGKDILLNKKS